MAEGHGEVSTNYCSFRITNINGPNHGLHWAVVLPEKSTASSLLSRALCVRLRGDKCSNFTLVAPCLLRPQDPQQFKTVKLCSHPHPQALPSPLTNSEVCGRSWPLARSVSALAGCSGTQGTQHKGSIY